jgi:aryl-alcohol dehydrogenase-like predicted oxidoreductase
MTTNAPSAASLVAPLSLGRTGPSVFPLGLGCMGMSDFYGEADEAESLRTIDAALAAGVSLLDTGDFYGMGHNEMLVGRALKGRRERALVSVKFGAQRGPDNSWLGFDARPAAVKTAVAYSLKRLGTEVIDVYRPARLDPAVPIEDTIGAIADLVKAGWVRHIGLSEVGVETIRRAAKVHPIVDLQIEYSIASRGPEAKIFPLLSELGIGATLYGVFSRGLLTGSKPTGAGDFRAYLPRFTGDAAAANAGTVARFASFAGDHRMTPAQLAIAYVRAKQPGLVPLIGARKVSQLKDALGALERPLDAGAVAELENIVPPEAIAGSRYAAPQMAHLDSER